MASISTVNSSNFLDSILPSFGQKRTCDAPIWNESMNMFIVNEHVSPAGHRSYDGVRIADKFMIVEHIGLFHSFSYLNGMDIYCFDGNGLKLIGQKKYGLKTYYDAGLVRSDSEKMLADFICQQAQALRISMPDSLVKDQASQLVASSYKSFKDENVAARIMNFRQLLLE